MSAGEARLLPKAAAAIRTQIRLHGGNEVCFVCTVDEQGHVATARKVAAGDVQSVLALPGVADRGELLVHNHPSGELTPSDADMEVAYRLHMNGVGFAIVDNEATRIYFVTEIPQGREIVLRGVVTSLSRLSMDLADAALVNDASGLTVSPLQQTPLARKEVLLQRVVSAPGQGLSAKALVAVVLHGEANYNYGTRWEEDVRFLLKDGTVYHRTEMPPDQLNVAASRQLEPRRWGRWRTINPCRGRSAFLRHTPPASALRAGPPISIPAFCCLTGPGP